MRTTGQDFLHSCRQRLGLHLSLFTMAIRVSLSSDILCVRRAYGRERRQAKGQGSSNAQRAVVEQSDDGRLDRNMIPLCFPALNFPT